MPASGIAREYYQSEFYPPEIPSTSVLPPLTGASQAAGPSTGQQDRRSSMHEAALDILQSTYPVATQPTLSVPPANSAELEIAPAEFYPPRPLVHGTKDNNTIYQRMSRDSHAGPAPSVGAGGFAFRKGVGYMCVACGRVCHQPGLHQTMSGGRGCFDFSGSLGSGMGFPHSSSGAGELGWGMPGDHMHVQAPIRDSALVGQMGPLMGGQMDPMMGSHINVGVQLTRTTGGAMVESENEGRRLSESAGLLF